MERTTGEDELACPKGTLVAVGSFSNGRRFRDGHLSYEWIRYSSLKDMRVMGGMGKILKCFIEHVHPEDVMTYVDARARTVRRIRHWDLSRKAAWSATDSLI